MTCTPGPSKRSRAAGLIRACVTGASLDPGGTGEQVEAEGLEGLLHAHLVAGGRGVSSPWRQVHREVALDNCLKLQALDGALHTLRRAGAEPLVMPGASLLRLYQDPGCRPMDDVDLLAPPGQRARVLAALRAAGWLASDRHPEVIVGRRLTVDVHTDLVNGERLRSRRRAGWLDPSQVWSRRRRVELEGMPMWALGPEEELLYSAAHALRHSYRRLTWLVDLHLQLEAGDLDWDRMALRARASGLGRPLVYGMSLLEGCGVRLPAAAASWLAGRRPAAATLRILSWILEARSTTCGGEVLWCLSCARGTDRARMLAEFLFPRPEVMLQVFPGLPRRLAPLAYILRCGQLVTRGTAEIVAAARRHGARA